jgi:phospholipid/cholesterol/gamma-HCH transport system substrate-binding protein
VQSFWTPIRVGLVVAAAAAAFGIGLWLIGADLSGRNRTYSLYAIFDDATGLGVRSRVQIAGIPVGQVEKIELDQKLAKAKVYLRIKRDFVLHRDASIVKRSESILGDFLLDISPGSADQPLLKDGDEIRNVLRQPSMNDVFNSLSKIAGDISDITGNLRKVLGGEEGENSIRALIASLGRITKGLEAVIDTSGAKLDATLSNFQRFSGDLSRISSTEGEDIVAILKNTREASAEARDILKTIGDVVGTQKEGELKDSVKSLKSNLSKLDATLANMQDITDKVNKGQGTIGHLINDDKLARNLDKASQQITSLLGTPDQLRVEINERSEFLVGTPKPSSTALQNARDTAYNPWTKNYFGLRIIPRPDKWYGIDVVDDPRGLTRRIKIQNCLPNTGPCPNPNPTGTGTMFYPDEVTQLITERQLKFNVFIAKRYAFISGRFGILENTGGFGIKLHLLNDALTISGDAFEFANPLKDHPRVKLYADYRFLDHVLITAGVDDMFNTPVNDRDVPTRIVQGRDYFLGAGFYFTDEDLKLLIAALPIRF